MRAGGDLPGGLDPHLGIIPAAEGWRQEGREVSIRPPLRPIPSTVLLCRQDDDADYCAKHAKITNVLNQHWQK